MLLVEQTMADSAVDQEEMIASTEVASQMMFEEQLAEMVATDLVVIDSAAAAVAVVVAVACEVASSTVAYFPD